MADYPAIETRAWGRWCSPVSIESIFRQPSTPGYPFSHDGDLYFLQSLASEGGRIALMAWRSGEAVCMTPAELNIRSAVHEYGGKCFCRIDNTIVFNNFDDGALYRQTLEPGSQPVRVTKKQTGFKGFADLVPWRDPADGSQWVIGVGEFDRDPGDNLNQILAVNIGEHPSIPQVLMSGADFYASPCVSGAMFAWVEWQLPAMPWDRSALFRGELHRPEGSGQLTVRSPEAVVDLPDHSVSQPGFCPDGTLVYACDSPLHDWSNLYAVAEDGHRPLVDIEAEIGAAHWIFGQTRWLAPENTPGHLLCIATAHEGDRLLVVDADSQCQTILSAPELGHLCLQQGDPEADPGSVLLVRHTADRPGSIVRVNISSGLCSEVGPAASALINGGYSVPEPVESRTSDGERTYGYFYPPFNPGFSGAADSKPPLLVTVHGGPTSRTSMGFSALRQYFTSLGFAVLDINHRGSTGYGRRYRQRLLGNWGEIDCMDIADLVETMVADGRVDSGAIFIRGGSAGGYAVLRALTRLPQLFAGGACYYGIGNLITLSEITHKFEGRYTDGLVGEPFDPDTARLPSSRYVQRSPIFEMGRLQAPLILFQGLLDKVVPPDVTREVVALLEQKGIRHDYVEYENEGHGFRAIDARIDSLQRETNFFLELL